MIVILCIPTENDYLQIPLNPFCYKSFPNVFSQFLNYLSSSIFNKSYFQTLHACHTEMKPDFTQNILLLCSRNENHKYQPNNQFLWNLHQLFRKFYEKTERQFNFLQKCNKLFLLFVGILISGFQSLRLNKFLICISLQLTPPVYIISDSQTGY